jgi:hypothetical protein
MANVHNPEGHPEVVTCEGPPDCQFEGEAAFEAACAGCPRCRHTVVRPDGTETEYQLKAH